MKFFDDDEKSIIEAVERGEFMPEKNLAERKMVFQKAANATTKKKKAISIRLLESDIQKIKALAIKKGLPYQTLIASEIHQFAHQK